MRSRAGEPELKLWRRGARDVQRAGAVGTDRAVPAVTIAGQPRVSFGGEPVEAGNQQEPSEQIPAGKKQSDARPGVGATQDAAVQVNRLHPEHGHLAVDLREAQLCGGIVQVQELNPLVAVEGAHPRDAASAKAARTIVENGKVWHAISLAGASLV